MNKSKLFVKQYMNKYDLFYIILLIIISFILYTTLFFFNQTSSTAVVIVNYNGEVIVEKPLNNDQLITLKKADYPLLLSDMVIEITNGKVRIKEETSPYNLCSKLGWIERPGLPLVCLPNYIAVRIENRDENNNDEDAVIGYAIK